MLSPSITTKSQPSFAHFRSIALATWHWPSAGDEQPLPASPIATKRTSGVASDGVASAEGATAGGMVDTIGAALAAAGASCATDDTSEAASPQAAATATAARAVASQADFERGIGITSAAA